MSKKTDGEGKEVEMNSLYIERSLARMHQEEVVREVSANRSAKRSRKHRGRSSFLQGFPGLFSLSLKRA